MANKKKSKNFTVGCLSIIVLAVVLVFLLYACSGNSSTDTIETQPQDQSNSQVEDYIRKANTYYAETGAYISGIADLTNADDYEETRQNVMTQVSDLQSRVQADLNAIPEDTTDQGLQLARQALDIDNNICLALYATLSTNDPSGADLIKQYVEQYNALKPQLDQYITN